MKTYITAVFFVLAFTASAETDQIHSAETPWNYVASSTGMSKYYGTWVGGIFYDGPMSFTGLTASRKLGRGTFHANASIGRKLDSTTWNKDGGDEIDTEIGQAWSADTGAATQVDASYTLSFMAVHPLGQLGNDFLSHVVSVSMPNIAWAAPYATLIRSDSLGKAPGSGWFAFGGLVGHVNLTDRVGIRLDYRTGYSFGIYGGGKGWDYHRLEASVPLAIGKSWTVVPALVGQVSAHGQKKNPFIDRSRLLATLTLSHRI